MPKIPDAVTITNNILRAFFGFHTPLVSHDKGKTWTLNSEYSIGETEDEKGNNYSLFLFPIRDDLSKVAENTPFYFSLTMTIRGNDQIEKINLKIFKDDHTVIKTTNSIPTELILRVEWDNNVGDKVANKHAQPHWHIHSYKHIDIFENRIIERQTILEILQEGNASINLNPVMNEMENHPASLSEKGTREIGKDEDIPLYKFHLAMVAEWDKSPSSLCNKTLSNENLKVWLPQCLNYLKEQLEYILGKIGTHESIDV